MSPTLPSRPVPLSVEGLETREVPAAGPWLTEAFQQPAAAGLPAGWSNWGTDGSATFRVDPRGAGLGDEGRLVTTGKSTSTARAWLNAPHPADVETTAAVFLQSTAGVQLFVRGQNLHTAKPSYYAVSVTRGAEVQLVKVVNGAGTVLGRMKTADYLSNRWVTVGVSAVGSKLRVTFHRGDTNQHLGGDGEWTRRPVAAIEVADAALRSGGNVGFARTAGTAGKFALDSLRVGPATAAGQGVLSTERFDNPTAAGLPAGWSKWQGGGASSFGVRADETLRVQAASAAAGRVWQDAPTPANVQVSASVVVDSLIPAGILARGSNLHTDAPTYYALTLERGVEATLWKVVNGTKTALGTIKSQDWLSGQWVQASLALSGDQLRVQLFRSDTGQYLTANGRWELSPAWALTRTDRSITGGGRVGLFRDAGYAGQLLFDNVIVTTAPAAGAPPAPVPTENDKPTGQPAPPEDRPTPLPPPTSPLPPASPPPASPPAGPPQTANPGLPSVPRHYDWIRLANLAYYGTPMGSFEQNLLKNSIDLVVPNAEYLDDIEKVTPDTPQFVYTNVSNIYLNLLTDWLAYADRTGADREAAFYHAKTPTTYNGSSASAVPVDRFWGAYRGTDAGWADVTTAARTATVPFALGKLGESVALGHVDRFREVNVRLKTPAAGGWNGRLEYVAAVDAQGRPTQWKTLTTLSDTTGFFRRSGQLTFDPPKDWVASSVGGSARLFYVRFRTTAAGVAPTVATVLGRDYTRGNRIPAFDAAADRDGDGYLNDAEYARRRSGFDARFVHETRVFYPNYGTMRFATNISNPSFRAWAVDYHDRIARNLPLASGFFVDNSIGRLAIDPSLLKEGLATYTEDYGSLLRAVNKKLMASGKWILANTAGANVSAEPISRNGVSFLEEFALRPHTANHVQFEDLEATLKYRRQLSGGKAYEILDSLPQALDANNPRTQLATLAMYYQLADPELSFLMLNGGNEPASTWKRHWIEAATYDVGKPTGGSRVLATGTDPANSRLTYKVYERKYENAVVLYKPLSYTRGVTGTIANNTATTHQLGGWYRPLRADGTLGAAVRQVSLRNGEGAVLVKA